MAAEFRLAPLGVGESGRGRIERSPEVAPQPLTRKGGLDLPDLGPGSENLPERNRGSAGLPDGTAIPEWMQSAVDRWEAEVKAAEEAARAPPPEIVAKALLDASWEEGRLQGFADGINDGLAQAAASLEAAATLALEGTAATLLETVEEARRDGALAAEGLMKSVLAVISATIPVLAKRVGEEEIKRFLDEIIPILADEPKIIIRVSPELVDKLTSRYPKGQINVVADDDIEIGDVRVDWRAGTAARDTQLQRKAALSALAMFGLSKSN